MSCGESCHGPRYVPFPVFKFDSQTGEGVPGAVFELEAGGAYACVGTTDAAGVITFCVLTCLTYTLRELSPAPGYQPLEHTFEICVDACGCIFVDGVSVARLDIPNTAITASFTAIKVNILTGEPLAGALYTLYQSGTPLGSVYSDETGGVTFTGLSPGMYELGETSPPFGFQPNVERLPVLVAADGSVTILGEPAEGFLLNNAPMNALAFQKIDAQTSQPLPGAVFRLSQNGTTVAEAASGPDGNVTFGFLPPGVYTLTELVTPPGFLPNPAVYEVVIETLGAITVDGVALDSFRVADVLLPGFSFHKTDSTTGDPLAGAVFELRQNGGLVASSTSDPSGFVSFSGLLPGAYQLVETLPAAGYRIHTEIHQVDVAADGAVTIDGAPPESFGVSDEPVVFSVLKTDEGGLPLADAVYDLRSHSFLVQSESTGPDGRAVFRNISPGEYTLTEAAAPPGFSPNPDVNTVLVSELGEVQINGEPTTQLTVVNLPLPPVVLPNLLGWMRSSETYGYVPGARIPNLVPENGVFAGWDFPWARESTLMQYFENQTIYEAALAGEYTAEALGVSEALFESSGRVIDESYVWDGGTDHQFFTDYYDGALPGGWASWANLNVPASLLSPQTQLPVDGDYTPYHYSLRRFTAYLDVDFSRYTVDSAFLISTFPSGEPDEFVFPLNDSIFVFVNGTLAYWTSTDLEGSGNISQKRSSFYNVDGILMSQEFTDSTPPPGARYAFTDGWYLTLGGSFRIADIAPYLENGKNVIDVIADDYYFGGGMSRISTEFSVTPLPPP